MYGYTDSNEVGPGKQGGKFGKNVGFVTKFEFNPNGGKDGAAREALDFTIQIGEREYRQRYFPITKVYAKRKDGGGEITDTNSEAYKKGLAEEVNLLNATLSDIVKCFVSEEDLKTALQTPISSFGQFATVLERLVKTNPTWNKTPVDVILQYQWSPQGENTVTFLELPTTVKHGQIITRSLGDGYNEVRTATSLKYVNAEGLEHPLKRGEWFVNSDFAKQTGTGAQNQAEAPAGTGTAGMNAGTGTGGW